VNEQSTAGQPGSWFLNRGLFSDHFLKARLPQGKEWSTSVEELAVFRKQLSSLYESTKAILPLANEAQTEKEFVQPVLDLLGYANSYIVQSPTQVGQQTGRPDYALFPDQPTKNKAYQNLKNNDYTLCIGVADAKYWERELDLARSNSRDTFTNVNPSFQIASYLTGTKQTWGILTNGRLWRLYCAKSHLPLGNYYQVDIVQLLHGPPGESLKYFYLFFRKASVVRMDGKSFLDRVLEESNQYAAELEADIKERAYDVVQTLCRGLAAPFPPGELTEQTLGSIYDNSLTLLYRLLFVLYAEARDLLPLTTNQSYRDKYSLHNLTQEIDETLGQSYQLSTKSNSYYQRVSSLFKLIDEGDSVLGVPEYNGGLFDAEEHAFLADRAVPDAFLVQAIHQLARIYDKELKREVAVDYNTLSERHLGSIYEGLLEFKPRIAAADLVTIKEKATTTYAPASKYPGKKIAYKQGELYLADDKGERKASGSYYTPEYIVNYIVENTLGPLVNEAHEQVKALKPEVDKSVSKWEKLRNQKQGVEPTAKYDLQIGEEQEKLLRPYLSLKVLDPAMGSGHFLARATDFLAEAIATDPDIKPPGNITEDSELTYYRRRVVESCIYGVDLNPLAVEMAKLTLWLGTMAKSKPLSFLNHHLRVGNSLIGARVADLDEIPRVKSKKGKPFDPSRAPVQIGHFEWAFNQKLVVLLKSRALIARLPTETLEDVHNKEIWERDFEHDMRRFDTLADLWASTYFDNHVRWDEYNTLVENLQSPEPDWDKLLQVKSVQKAAAIAEKRRFFHWELEFPEVFYDDQSNHKENPGFDVVIGNPPYDVLEKERLGTDEPHAELARYLEADKEYHHALGGKVNLFRPFLIRGHLLVRRGGFVGKIIPLALVDDYSCARTRAYLLDNSHFLALECFPQKDNANDRIFEDAKLSTCVLIFSTPGPTEAFFVRTYRGKYFTENAKTAYVTYEQIKVMDPDVLPIPLVTQAEWDLAIRIHTTVPAQRVSEFAALSRGEMNQTIFSEYITGNANHVEMIKGVEIDRYAEHWYLSQGEKQWFDEISYYAKTKIPKAIPNFRIGIQRITGIDENTRLRATLYRRRVYFADSTNSVASGDESRLYFLLALLNSRLFNWRFKLNSTNNNVSTNELDRLPVRKIKVTTEHDKRAQLLVQGKKIYEEYLKDDDCSEVLAFVVECFPKKADGSQDIDQEQSDVVYDLLVFLAGEMIRLNKEKQLRTRAFLSWLEKEILKGPVDEQENKSTIRNFHEVEFDRLMDVFKENNAVPDPCPSNVRDTLATEFTAATDILTPLKVRIQATDDLIDQIVYLLYGLTQAEIAIVEGR
jgi:Alw26I/Eco31I/Esp3I family type II restriction m6 adenine DNA methyltransferase